MNVLIYAGSTIPSSNVSHPLRENLKKILSRAYDVKLVDSHILNHHPWQNHTSLLIIPHLDPREHDALAGNTGQILHQWVGRGGKCLGIGTGAQFAGNKGLGLLDLDWKLIQSPSPPQSHRQIVFPKLDRQQSNLSHLSITPDDALFVTHLPAEDKYKRTDIWASYRVHDNPDNVVGVGSSYQAGYVALVGVDIGSHVDCLINILDLIGLEGLTESTGIDLEEPSTLYLFSCLSSITISNIHQNILQRSCTLTEPKKLQDAHNTFMILTDMESPTQKLSSNDSLVLVLCSETSLIRSIPISFDIKRYFSFIAQSSTLGNTVLYGETVSSTQTLLEKNSQLADLLPSGTVSIARKQIQGRGRGANNWISTTSSIQVSLLLKVDHLGSSLVFVQYLFGLAVVEWIEKKFNGKLLVRLKWPNDIYGSTSGNLITDFKKMGGILVNCSSGGLNGTASTLIIGLGLNHHSAPHSTATSLAELIHATNVAKNHDDSDRLVLPSIEETISGILTCFDQMWNQFKFQGFQPFMSLYLSRWLHSDQVIKYEKTGERLKILGLDPSFGLLRTKLVHDHLDHFDNQAETIINLQPDSNSFDMFSGLIKTKF